MYIHFIGERFTFFTLTFQRKQFKILIFLERSAKFKLVVNSNCIQKMVDPSFQYYKKIFVRNSMYSLVLAIFLPFFIDFQADRPATLIFLRDHRGWPWLLRKDFLSNRNLCSEWKLSSFCKYNTFFLLVIATLTFCDSFQEIFYGGVLFHILCQWYFLLHFLNFTGTIKCCSFLALNILEEYLNAGQQQAYN